VKPSRRRPLLVICLALGAAANVAVAIACWEMASRSADELDGVPLSLPIEQTHALWRRLKLPHWPEKPNDGFTFHGWGWISQHAIREPVPADGEPPVGSFNIAEWRQGWPLEALSTQVLVQAPSADSNPDVQIVHHQANIFGWRIPTGPIWSGLIVNTLFYAAIVWLMIRGPWETRRRWREWHGRCGACGYPFGASAVCTECGRPVPAWRLKQGT
jgi:hypothetical protein